MSYILEALKKSERARPPGAVPDLFTVHGPQPRPPAPRWPARAIVAAALLLAVPAIALWAWIGTGCRDESAVRPPVAVSPQLRAEDSMAPAAPRVEAAPTLARLSTSVRRPSGKLPQPPAQSRRRSPRSPAPAGAPAAKPASPATSAAPAPAAVPAAPVPTAPAPVIASTSATTVSHEAGDEGLSAPAPVPQASAFEELPPADGRVLDLAELPASIRAGLPALLVSGHVWSEEPSLRLLSVDDRLLREGGEAAPGVSLREITPAGAVFAFKGWRFRVDGGRQ